ncbi:MAG: VOC family protein [Williamsia sp.]|nr:VOC family protein [Williamsia sp.]
MQKITTFLWFDTQAEEAMNFYLSVFKHSKAGKVSRYGDAGPGPKGSVMTASFELEGQEFIALNGGPQYHFTPAISLFVNCTDQQEVDELWDKLCEGGKPGPCGWLEDKFGLSWQIVPREFFQIIQNPDPEKSKKAMQAMMKMQKLDLDKLREAIES